MTSITGPDGLEVAATFPEGRQLDAEREAVEAAKRDPKDLIEYRKSAQLLG